MKRPRRGTGCVNKLARASERVDELGAHALAVSKQARDVAPVDAAARYEKVVARAPSDAAQLKLSLRRRGVLAKPCACERESRVTLDARACGEQSMALCVAL